jgi:ADP-ribose pyrophosphatase YjhB (NUDIX family)
VSHKRFVVCVDGVYIKDGKILLLKRSTEPFNSYWHLIGGHVEENETLKEALKREFKEETNLDIDVGDIIDGRIEKNSDRIKIIATFKVTSAQGKIKLNPRKRRIRLVQQNSPRFCLRLFQVLAKERP